MVNYSFKERLKMIPIVMCLYSSKACIESCPMYVKCWQTSSFNGDKTQ